MIENYTNLHAGMASDNINKLLLYKNMEKNSILLSCTTDLLIRILLHIPSVL